MFLFLLTVVFISLSGVMMPGPVSAAVILKGRENKFSGVYTALGHLLVEGPLIFLIYFGLVRFLKSPLLQNTLTIGGGLFLLLLGEEVLRKRKKKRFPLSSSATFIGFLTTLLNPYFLLWWATVGVVLIIKSIPFGGRGVFLFLVFHWGCDLGWLSFLSFFSHRTKGLWGGKMERVLLFFASFILLGFGGWLIFSFLISLYGS